MLIDNTQKILDSFGGTVTDDAKENLSKSGKNSSGSLSKSIGYTSKVSKNSFELAFQMEDYGEFQDKGVNGFLKKHGSPYSYRDKYPDGSKLDKWIVRKGIAPRDAKGHFISRKSMQFLIARSIFFNGIKPSKFFTNAFEPAFKDLPEELIEAFGLDSEKFLKSTLKDNSK